MRINWTELQATSSEFDLEISELFSIFFKQAEKKIDEIQYSIQRNDRAKLKDAAHFMAGSAGALYLEDLRSLFKNIEDNSSANDFRELDATLGAVKSEISLISQELSKRHT